MTGNDIRSRFLTFFAKRGHIIVPSSSLVPENDPTVLFNTAGMQPLVPYLMGLPHPTGGTRIVNSQKCVRTNDIDEVGDNTHLTFFEMLGNWSLGDYFKRDAIMWSFEFLTSSEEGLGLDPKRLYVTVFEGDENAPRDEEAYLLWKAIFEAEGMDPEKRIFFMSADANWWSPGDNGPCGPDSEMFYDVTGTLTEGLSKEEFLAADEAQKVVEVWNDVFMEYEKKAGKVIGKLASQNVDTGSGLERITAMVQGVDHVFATDLFTPIIDKISEYQTIADDRAVRIIADHIRAATFLICDGVSVSNTDQGYVLRRLLRRSIRQADKLGMPSHSLATIATTVCQHYGLAYPNLILQQEKIINAIHAEENQFRNTLESGLKRIDTLFKTNKILHSEAIVWPNDDFIHNLLFDLYQTYGFPFELSIETIQQKRRDAGIHELRSEDIEVLQSQFLVQMEAHQAKSRSGAEQKFKGGLADHSDTVVQYHTTTHLLLAALREILGDHVHQAGSNITAERMRFDFTHPEKLEQMTLSLVESWVNTAIKSGGTVTVETMPKSTAATDPTTEGSFWEKYPETVTVYTMIGPDGTVYSRELCGGPHVSSLDEITGTFKITKEESSSAGIRRIKAVLR